jgi:hypothetical protein
MCEFEEQLDLIHKWLHKSHEALSDEDIETARLLEHRILELVNDSECPNGVKLLAVYDALVSGVDTIEARMNPEPEDPATIH